MEHDSLQHQQLESAYFPVKGMESILATVSGYHGVERFNLIKLISRTGASYIGSMNRSVTHLICWKFEGKKYELAKKLRIAVVNHSWIEECVKRGRRVSEEPYTYRSGEEIGPLCLDLLGITLATVQAKASKKDKKPEIDVECEEIGAAWTDPILLNEDLPPGQTQKSHGSNRSVRKTIKRNLMMDRPIGSRYSSETLAGPTIVELEEPGTSLPAYSCGQKKRISTSPKPHPKGRRLVKKHISTDDVILTPNMEHECNKVKVSPENNNGNVVKSSDDGRHQNTTNRHASYRRCFIDGAENDDAVDVIEEVKDVNDDNRNASARGVPEVPEPANEKNVEIDHGNIPPASCELSCVICWTDFSSTRGVLPCGHRFCFSCIQDWADHVASRGKPSTCPLCKASFKCITKVDDAVSSDQKIYSQTIPDDISKMNLYFLPQETHAPPSNPSAAVCVRCFSREPEDLLVRCQLCHSRCVHSYCLDPPLFPWACVHCKDLQMLYLHNR